MKTTNTNTKTTKKELATRFPMLRKYGLLDSYTQTARREYKTERGALAWLQRKENLCNALLNEPRVSFIRLDLYWTKGGAYGHQVRCRYGEIHTTKGVEYQETEHKTGGCGYDKLSTCAAECLNDHLRGELLLNRSRYIRARKQNRAPYGLAVYEGMFPHFEGGVGISSTMACLSWLGFTCTLKSGNNCEFLEAIRK